MDIFIFLLGVTVVPIVINKTTEHGRFDFVHPYLREIWMALLVIFTWYVLEKPALAELLMRYRDGWIGYLTIFVIGGAMLCLYWFITGWMLAKRSGPSPVAESQTIEIGHATEPTPPAPKDNTVQPSYNKKSIAVEAAQPLPDNHAPTPAVDEKPDLKMALIYPKEPALIFVNNSGVVLREPKFSPGIWNLDRKDPADGRAQILPIPVQSGDWIRPHETQGPNTFIGQDRAKQLWKDGDRLFGVVTLACPECVTTRVYIVYIVCGKGGWYSEIDTSKMPLTWPDISKIAHEGVDEFLATIPEASRIPIAER